MDDTRGYSSLGGRDEHVDDARLAAAFVSVLKSLGERRKVLALPPDGTRAHSKAGVLLKAAYDHYGSALAAVMPALGTHRPLDAEDIRRFFPGVPERLFLPHDWRHDTVTLGTVPGSFVSGVSEGACAFSWPAQVNRLLVDGDFDLILSLGQVVPHEVVGMANHSKNVFVGVGGKEAIDRSHWLGAAYGIERTLGRVDTPVRAVLDYTSAHFASDMPILYALTVVGPDGSGGLATRGFFTGFDRRPFEHAAALSAQVNVTKLERKPGTALVWLDPAEYRSTWLGNKAIYRTRLAMADGGTLVIIAPGVDCFGEDPAIDATIRRYGYRGTDSVRALVDSGELADDLAGAAHLVHGSTEGRFRVVYASGLSKDELEGVGYEWADPGILTRRYDPARLREGWNALDGEDFYFIRNPGLGLWMA
ncbi:MAG: DUF2088 domain-containing protein [Spirochaetia bacterium]|nr:DUF2088 domain-containing protein [Spirochaetia bacterium]